MRVNKSITITAGTPVNAASGMSSAQMIAAGINYNSPGERIWINRYACQMQPASTGVGYVMDGIYGLNSAGDNPRVPVSSVAGDVSVTLSPGSGANAGTPYTDIANLAEGIDLTRLWFDGATTGDKIKLSYDQRV